jgi:Family of unknown function (DUF6194)
MTPPGIPSIMSQVTEDDVRRLACGLPDVWMVTASEDNGAPEVAWGDSFFYYDPSGRGEDLPPQGFATLVTKDYPGFDTASNLDRPGVFRVNVAVGRAAFETLFGYSPTSHADHYGEYDYADLDRVVPHPVYAGQGWVCVVSPGPDSAAELESLLRGAHALAAERHHRRTPRG